MEARLSAHRLPENDPEAEAIPAEMVNGEPETVSLGPARTLAGEVDAPIGPGPEEDALLRAAPRATADPATDERDEPAENKNLPPLETLIRRIPAATRAALDELFRAKFIAVRRVPERALKGG